MFNIVSQLFGDIIEIIERILKEYVFPIQQHKLSDRLKRCWFQYRWNNTGIALGTTKQLPIEKCYEGILVSGKPGTGKSQCISIPTCIRAEGSFIIHDPSGEILKTVGSYLKYVRGYTIKVMNALEPEQSDGFNFIERIEDLSDIDTVSELLLRQLEGASDAFWTLEGRNTLNLLQSILLRFKKEYRTPHNLLHLTNAIAAHPELIEEIVREIGDKELLVLLQALSRGDAKTLSNVIATCRSVLGIFRIPTVSKVTQRDTLGNLSSLLRHRRTAIFITTPTLEARRLAPVTNIFLSQVFRDLLKEVPQPEDNPVFLLLDEMSTLYLPDVEALVANCRKYKVSFVGMVQNTSQLNRQYGIEGARAIKGSLTTRIVFPGSPIEEAKEYSEWLGKYSYVDATSNMDRIRPVKTPSEIMRMKRDRILLLSGNQFGKEISVTPLYLSSLRKQLSNLPQYIHQGISEQRSTPLIDFSQFTYGQKN